MGKLFDVLLKKQKDPALSEFERGRAAGKLDEMRRQADKYNKANNPEKYKADRLLRAKKRLEYLEKQATKTGTPAAPKGE